MCIHLYMYILLYAPPTYLYRYIVLFCFYQPILLDIYSISCFNVSVFIAICQVVLKHSIIIFTV